MPKVADRQDVKRVGEPLDLRSWISRSEERKDARGRVSRQYLNVPNEVHDELIRGREILEEDRLVGLESKNFTLTIEVARRNLGKDEARGTYEMEFAALRPLTLKGCVLLAGQEDASWDGETEEPSVTKYFAAEWLRTARNNANARMETAVNGLDRRQEQAIKTIALKRGWSLDKAREAWEALFEGEDAV